MKKKALYGSIVIFLAILISSYSLASPKINIINNSDYVIYLYSGTTKYGQELSDSEVKEQMRPELLNPGQKYKYRKNMSHFGVWDINMGWKKKNKQNEFIETPDQSIGIRKGGQDGSCQIDIIITNDSAPMLETKNNWYCRGKLEIIRLGYDKVAE